MSSLSYCPKENKPCVRWVEKYFKDCLCNVKDDFSFGFGIISLLSWGVAEIPQIITNFNTKSSHGVSLTFLLTWVAGQFITVCVAVLLVQGRFQSGGLSSGTSDGEWSALNMPELSMVVLIITGLSVDWVALLPTQYYTALLYTISTVVLVIQSVYYDHFYRLWKRGKVSDNQQVEDEKKPLKYGSSDSGIPIPNASAKATPFYFTSARSLAGSGTPPYRTFLRAAKSGPSAMGLDCNSSDDDDESGNAPTQPRPIPRSVGYGTFLATSLNLPLRSKAIYVGLAGRKLLQEHGSEHSVYGQWLGWLMAAIYMGGRLPQIWLNIKRGSVEGLNPLMFIFALVANVTYVASILVRTTEWEKIKANMPWLLDAVVCVALDLFIILQYIYYRYSRKTRTTDYGDYMEATKNVAS